MKTAKMTDEKKHIRELAAEVFAHANSKENEEIRARWKAVNSLKPVDRAPVWCRPVGCWPELLPEDELICEDPWLKGIERMFKRILVKKDINDDTPVSPYFGVSASFDVEPENVWGLDVKREQSGKKDGSWKYDPPLKDEEDFDRLTIPRYTYNSEKTERKLDACRQLFEDILPVRLTCGPPLGATICTYAANLRGLAQIMMDMAMNPDLMHRLMEHIMQGVLSAMDDIASAGLLTPNNNGPMTCSEDIGETSDEGITYKNMWCMANSQEFDQVSPEMWEEFLLDYQRPILEQFGLVGYGCCENLTHKIDGVLSLENLRIFVCSAWTDMDQVLPKLGKDYVIMWRQKATDVVFNSLDQVEAELKEGAKKLKGYHYQIVLRELQTLNGNDHRLHRWTDMAKEMAAKYA